MTSPTGIDLRPDPPPATRLRRSISYGVVGLAALLMIGVIYGNYAHGASTPAAATEEPPRRGLAPSMMSAKEIVAVSGQTPAAPVQTASLLEPSVLQAPQQPGAPAYQQPVYQPQAYQQPAPPQVREPTTEEKRLAAAYQAEQRAIDAPASPDNWKTVSREPNSPTPHTAATVDPDGQDKEGFIEAGRKRRGQTYLSGMRTPQLTKYEIKAGWMIPAVLLTTMDSDLPGEITALVSENVYDTATGRYRLIPQGSKLFGVYNSHVSYGQSGAQAVWDRLIFPDGSNLNLEAMAGHDAQGRTGFRDQVDNHYKRLIGMALLTSAFYAVGVAAQNGNRGALTYPSPGEVAASAAATNMTQSMVEITRKNLNVAPTITIRPGYKLSVMVNRDMVFDGPYRAN